jgi:pilus assembly protein CpaB
VSVRTRRRRGLLLVALALASGGLAAARVRDQLSDVESRVGPLVPVAVAARELRAGARIGPRDVAVRRVPAAFVPRGSIASPAQALGGRTAVALAAGGYLTVELLGSGVAAPGGWALRRGERALELAVSGGRALDEAMPGSRVDVVVSTEPRAAAGRTFVALEGVELLSLRPHASAEAIDGPREATGREAGATATLRVTLKQAVYLSAADNFAREVRLLARPPGDRRRGGREAVAAGDL